ncbi:MAG: prepilin-type N-terminal cleavage/methylation domain-containing protein [Planctomycetota bacterium]
MIRGTVRGRSARAFTLVELTVVLLVLAILAGVVLPRIVNASDEAQAAAAATNLAIIQKQVDRYAAEHGVYPDAIPKNPFVPDDAADYYAEPISRAWKIEPEFKTPIPRAYTHWWYNPNLGSVRARVSEQASDAETLALYNRVNGRSIPSLDYMRP